MTLAELLNVLRILRSIDLAQLKAVSYSTRDTIPTTGAGSRERLYLIGCDDEEAKKIWSIIERRHEAGPQNTK
jgi:hypothetical protein